MVTSSNGNIFCVTGPLWGKSTNYRWIPLTKVSEAGRWCFLDLRLNKRLIKQSIRRWFEAPWPSLWSQCNYHDYLSMFKTHIIRGSERGLWSCRVIWWTPNNISYFADIQFVPTTWGMMHHRYNVWLNWVPHCSAVLKAKTTARRERNV